jgi:energy-coupling factor transporter ATP-binding protein EcfA2
MIHFNLLIMYPTRLNRLLAMVVVYGLLLQGCSSGLHAIIEAPVLKQENSTTDDHVPGSGERLSAGVLASSRTMDSRVREMLGSTSLAEPAALLPAAVVPTLAPASVPETQSLAVVHAVSPSFVGPFTASSGERVLFSQQGGKWQAVLAPSTRPYGHKYMLHVVGSEDIGASLAALRGADAWSSRSRVHVLSRPTPPYSPCIYVGKLGLWGGMLGAYLEAEGAKGLSPLVRKLADPQCVLSESESMELLTSCVATGVENAQQVKDKEVVIVIGDTGVGKSTFVNYLLGCAMVEKAPGALPTEALDDYAYGNVVAVQPRSEGGPCDEVMPIGHEETSKTYMPQVASAPDASSLFYCDCPGFSDNRGSEINMVNAVNIKHVLQAAKCVKVVILIDFHTARSSRGHGLKETMKLCTQLFGNDTAPAKFQDSVMLGVTRAPENISLDALGRLLERADPSPIMQTLSKRVFLYDPLDRGGAYFCSRVGLTEQLAGLQGIPQAESCSMFQTVLTADDEQTLIAIVEKQSETLKEQLAREAYAEAGACWQALQRLKVVDNVRVDRPLQLVQLRLREVASERAHLFMECLLGADLQEAQNHLSSLRAMSQEFDAKEDLGLALDKLEHQYDVSCLLQYQAFFGARAWAQYFGEVGATPPLPADINQILNSPCPFWSDKQVSDTHLLVLIPAMVDGRPFTLDLLGELIKRPKEGGHKTSYDCYSRDVQEELGSQFPGRSYWVLMTREVIEGSRSTDYASQKALIAAHASVTGLPYELPGALEAATIILTHYVRHEERLYAGIQWSYTRCRERIDNKYPLIVGGFSSGGLLVRNDRDVSCDYFFGVSCLRKF